MKEVSDKLIEKIAQAVEIVYDPYGLKKAQRDFTSIFIKDLANNNDLPIDERMALIQEYEFLLKKNKNRKKIIQDTSPYLNEGAQPKAVDDSWVVNFWDKSGTISDSFFQDLWSRILAEEVNNPKTVSKKLLHNLSLMSKKDANNFLNLSRFCFYDKKQNIAHPIIFIKEHAGDYSHSKITTKVLNELEQYSLIETNYETGFAFNNKKVLCYQNYIVELRGKRIHVGNVRLTEDGQKLFKIIDKKNNSQIFEYTIEQLQYNNTSVQVTNKYSGTNYGSQKEDDKILI